MTATRNIRHIYKLSYSSLKQTPKSAIRPRSKSPKHSSPHSPPLNEQTGPRENPRAESQITPENQDISSLLETSVANARLFREKSADLRRQAHRPLPGLTFNLGAPWLRRQHSKEHSRVIKRGKWSPGGEPRLFEAVSSKGNLAMTSGEPGHTESRLEAARNLPARGQSQRGVERNTPRAREREREGRTKKGT